MLKKILAILVLVIVVWAVYVSFYGKPEDIQLRNNLLVKTKDLGLAVGEIFNSESRKIKSGEYDKLFTKLDETLDELRKVARDKDHHNEIKRLSEEKERLEKSIRENQENHNIISEEKKKLQTLADDIQTLSKKLQE